MADGRGSTDVRDVLAEYPPVYAAGTVSKVTESGGFSGAGLWRIETQAGPVGLRRWPPEHPSRQRLMWIHAVLSQVAAKGLGLIAAPLRTRRGSSFVTHRGHFWQLEPWLPGRNDFRQHPRPERIAAALEALARVHRAAEDVAGPLPESRVCPAVDDRRSLCRQLRDGLETRLAVAVGRSTVGPLGERGRQLLEHYRRRSSRMADQLQAAAEITVPLQPCLRDVWHEHILFREDQVCGIIDYGAMRLDSVAVDISRLLGSMARSDPGAWRIGLRAYETSRPLAEGERRLVPLLHESSLVLSGIHWLRWLYLDNRQFEAWSQVERRIDEILEDLEHL